MSNAVHPNLKNKAVAAAAVSAFIAVCLGTCYFGDLRRFYEMTFLSNFIASAVLLTAAVKILLTGRDIPHFLYLDAASLLAVVVVICAVYAPGVCFSGASVLLHLVDPILMTAFYLLFCDARGHGIPSAVATTLVFPSLYYIFMIVFGRLSGSSIYIYFDTNAMSAVQLVLGGVYATLALLLFGSALMMINSHIRQRHDKRVAVKESGAESHA